jgi:hypothetical protein
MDANDGCAVVTPPANTTKRDNNNGEKEEDEEEHDAFPPKFLLSSSSSSSVDVSNPFFSPSEEDEDARNAPLALPRLLFLLGVVVVFFAAKTNFTPRAYDDAVYCDDDEANIIFIFKKVM